MSQKRMVTHEFDSLHCTHCAEAETHDLKERSSLLKQPEPSPARSHRYVRTPGNWQPMDAVLAQRDRDAFRARMEKKGIKVLS